MLMLFIILRFIEYVIYSLSLASVLMYNFSIQIEIMSLVIVTLICLLLAYQLSRKWLWSFIFISYIATILISLYKLGKWFFDLFRNIAESPQEVNELLDFYQQHGSPYYCLGLARLSTKAQIKDRYYQLSSYFHPDKSNELWAQSIYQLINQSYVILNRQLSSKILGVIDFLNQSPEVDLHHNLERFFHIFGVSQKQEQKQQDIVKPLLIRFSLSYLKIFKQFEPKLIKY